MLNVSIFQPIHELQSIFKCVVVVCKCDTRARCMHRTLYTGCGRKLCTSGHEAIPYEKNKKKIQNTIFSFEAIPMELNAAM